MQICVNGENQSVAAGTTIQQLLEQLEITSPAVAVELNRAIQPRDTFVRTVLSAGDTLEIVTLVGGG